MIAAATIDRNAESRPAAAEAAERRCLVTGQTLPRAQLVRFVAGPDGAVVPDLGEKLPGRGLWVRADRDALVRADARSFARARRGAVTVPDDLLAQVEAGLRRRLMDYVGMARRAGALVAGFEKTRAALRSGAVHLLIAAGDGAEDGRAKLRALRPGVAEMTALSAEEVGAALGRDGIVHAGVTDPRLAAVIAREADRLAGVRGGSGKMRDGIDSDKVDRK